MSSDDVSGIRYDGRPFAASRFRDETRGGDPRLASSPRISPASWPQPSWRKNQHGDHLESETRERERERERDLLATPVALSFAASARRRRRFFTQTHPHARAHTRERRTNTQSRVTDDAGSERWRRTPGQFGEIDADGGGSILLVSRDRYRYATEIHREGRRRRKE